MAGRSQCCSSLFHVLQSWSGRRQGWVEGGREGGREGGQEELVSEGPLQVGDFLRKGEMEGRGREKGKEGERERGREGKMEGGREGGREGRQWGPK
jgi:hypothetical protein